MRSRATASSSGSTPADLWGGVHVYSADNAYLGHAPCLVKAGFFDMDEAREHARARSQWMKAEKAALAAHKTYSAHQLGLELSATGTTPTPTVEAKVVKPVFGRKGDALPVARVTSAPDLTPDEIAAGQAAMITDLTERLAGRGPAPEETETDRFKRALDLERRAAAGEALTTEQQRWLSVYQSQPEYRAQRGIYDAFGDTMFG